MENCILVDWLTFTSKIDSISSLLDLLGLTSADFTECAHGRNGYRQMITFQGISILYDGRDDMGICVDMSGIGCRSFESFSKVGWPDLFSCLLYESGSYNITRLDAAYDDHSGILNIDVLRDATDDHHYVSRSRTWEVDYGSEGTTIYHGSKRSDMLIRIYDKAAEQGLDQDHWIRVELQMRDQNAIGFVKSTLNSDLGCTFLGVLRNYLRYVTPVPDVNMSRWPETDYWFSLCCDIQRIRIWSSPGSEYTVFNLENYVINQAGNALDCYLSIFGTEDLIYQLGKRSIRMSPKYEKLKQAYFERLKNGC